MRRLDPEEERLWHRVTASIRPLSREPAATPPAPSSEQVPARPNIGFKRPTISATATSVLSRRPMIGRTLDGGWDRKLRSGDVEPDRILDLHGKSLDSAWEAIDRSLERAIVEGDRVLLLITGHERAGEPPVRRGKIRAAVHDWLAASRHAGNIAAVRGAHRRHGGGGSLYVVLRRR